MRRWRDEDLEPYARICADPEVIRYINEAAPRNREQSRESMTEFVAYREERGFGLWAVEEKETG
ncbi:MAG: GNAT family N-acetyltransferase [Rubrobacteraceae bacterium]